VRPTRQCWIRRQGRQYFRKSFGSLTPSSLASDGGLCVVPGARVTVWGHISAHIYRAYHATVSPCSRNFQPSCAGTRTSSPTGVRRASRWARGADVKVPLSVSLIAASFIGLFDVRTTTLDPAGGAAAYQVPWSVFAPPTEDRQRSTRQTNMFKHLSTLPDTLTHISAQHYLLLTALTAGAHRSDRQRTDTKGRVALAGAQPWGIPISAVHGI